MRQISSSVITQKIKDLCLDANYFIGTDTQKAMITALKKEKSETGKFILNQIVENHRLAADERMAICQDTGTVVVFAEVGQEVFIGGKDIGSAINEGVMRAYNEGCLRKSVVCDPVFNRTNTKDNTPAVIHYELVPGDKIKLSVMIKGSGSENMSALKMLKISDGIKGLKDFIIGTVKRSGGKACPPLIIGAGVGGNFERCAILSKKALLKNINEFNPDPEWAKTEKDILDSINRTGIGPQGAGGTTTALGVHIISEPCHIASLPAAVNIQCHAGRHKTITI